MHIVALLEDREKVTYYVMTFSYDRPASEVCHLTARFRGGYRLAAKSVPLILTGGNHGTYAFSAASAFCAFI